MCSAFAKTSCHKSGGFDGVSELFESTFALVLHVRQTQTLFYKLIFGNKTRNGDHLAKWSQNITMTNDESRKGREHA